MKDTNKTIHIIGAGVSGLTAAQTLNKLGYKFKIIEQSDRIGGRVQTNIRNGLTLDQGFQVILDQYPAIQEFVDLQNLKYTKFEPASIIFYNGKKHLVGDLQRNRSFLWSTLFAGVGSVVDKWRIYTLSRKLKQKNISDIFKSPEITTLQYLQDYGFSDDIIAKFFKPFYTGIFLESELATSSRMFEFVFKMFSHGNAIVPAAGIQALPEQLATGINDYIQYNCRVKQVVGDKIYLTDGTILNSDYTIIAAPVDGIVPNLPTSDLEWHRVQTLYFDTDEHGFDQPIIGLIADDDCLSNNFHFLNDVFYNHPKVISVSVIKSHKLNHSKLEERVRQELSQYAHIKANNLIDIIEVNKALPNLDSINYAMTPSETQLTEHTFLAGDYLSNASINAAMLNGKAAAQAVVSKIEDRVILN